MISVGIDIGSFSVKLVELEAQSRGYIINNIEIFPLNPDPTKDQEVEVIDILKNIEERYRNKSPKYCFAIPQTQVASRKLEFPFRERHKILQSVPFELEDELPFSQENSIFDAKVIEYRGAGSEVFATVCPREFIEKTRQPPQDVGLDPDLLSTTGMAFTSLVESWMESPPEKSITNESENEPPSPEPNDAIAYVQIGHRYSTVIIYQVTTSPSGDQQHKTLMDISTIAWGGHNLALAIAEKTNLHYLEALKAMRTQAQFILSEAGVPDNTVQMSKAMEVALKPFSHRLNLILMDVQSQRRLNIKSVLLSGGISQIKNLAPMITQRLHIPANPLRGLELHPNLDLLKNPHREMEALTAFSLAIEGLRKPKNPATNFLKEEFRKESQTFKLFWTKWAHTVQVGAAALILLFTWALLRDQFASTMSDLSYQSFKKKAQQIAGLKGSKAKPSHVRRYIKSRKKDEKSMKAAEGLQNLVSALDILRKISKLSPNQRQLNMDIRRLIIDFDNVSLEAQVSDAKSIPQVLQALKPLSKNGKVSKVPTQYKATQGKTIFGLQFKTRIHSEDEG